LSMRTLTRTIHQSWNTRPYEGVAAKRRHVLYAMGWEEMGDGVSVAARGFEEKPTEHRARLLEKLMAYACTCVLGARLCCFLKLLCSDASDRGRINSTTCM